MDERKGKKPEDLIKELEGAEVTELDDRDLEGAAGGSAEPNCNCSCGGGESISSDPPNCNCGC